MMASEAFLPFSVFDKVFGAVRASMKEQERIERTLGRAFLEKLAGRHPDLPTIYEALGGDDPIARQLFRGMTRRFDTLDVDPGHNEARAIANSAGVAASKDAVAAGNPIFAVEGTALNTLAQLGGDEFRRTYRVP